MGSQNSPAFLGLFENHKREGRVINPLLKTIDLLLSRMCIDRLVQNDAFANRVLYHLREEEKGCKDIHRLFSIINVSLGLLRCSEKNDKVRKFLLEPSVLSLVSLSGDSQKSFSNNHRGC